jgi:hypothetical protein
MPTVKRLLQLYGAAKKAHDTFDSKTDVLRAELQKYTDESIVVEHLSGDGFGVGLESTDNYAHVSQIISIISTKGFFDEEDITGNMF